MKKIIATMLCAAMLTLVLAGCSGDEEDLFNYFDDRLQSEEPAAPQGAEDDEASEGVGDALEELMNTESEFDAVFAAFAPDTVMMHIDDFTVTWGELFFYMNGHINGLRSNIEGAIDWSEVQYDDVSYADLVLTYALDNALMYKSFEYGAKLRGISLTDEHRAMVQSDFEQMAAMYGGEEILLQLLWLENGCYSKELLDYFLETGFLANLLFAELYGEAGQNVTDEDAMEFIGNEEFLMAMHILRMKPEEGEEDTALAEAEEILRQLNEYDGDDFKAFFTDLMFEHSEDEGGLVQFPGGYLFQYGDMVQPFYMACTEMEIGEFSGIVETEYGYHILLRLPIDFDAVPSSFPRYGDFRSLRIFIAESLFDVVLAEWRDSLEVSYSAVYESMDLASLLEVLG